MGSKENSNMGQGSSCPSVHWYGELPEIMAFLLLFLFVLTIFRRWQNKRRAKTMRRALSQTMALQTVSSTVPYNSGPDLAWRGMGNRCLEWMDLLTLIDSLWTFLPTGPETMMWIFPFSILLDIDWIFFDLEAWTWYFSIYIVIHLCIVRMTYSTTFYNTG